MTTKQKKYKSILKIIPNWLIAQTKMAKPLHPDHLGVCLMVLFLGSVLFFISERIGIFDPIKAAFDDFYTTDVYYEVMHSEKPDKDEDIVIVDMTDLTTRDEIAQVITDIKNCKPKVLCIDLIFERPSFDSTDDVALLQALKLEDCHQVMSCKLRDYEKESSSFRNCLYSFFHDVDNKNTKWGYSNYRHIRMGGITRETSLFQKTNDSIVYSLPYTAACEYQGVTLKRQDLNERLIVYDDIDFDTIASSEVLQNSQKIRGKLVLLGTLHEEADIHFTPLGKMAGVKVVAYSIRTYIKGGEIKYVGKANSIIIAMIAWWIAAIIGYLIERRHPIVFGIIAKIFNFVLAAFLIWICFEVYTRWNYYIDLFYPLLGLAMVEDIREMYIGFLRWVEGKTGWSFFKKSLYKKEK